MIPAKDFHVVVYKGGNHTRLVWVKNPDGTPYEFTGTNVLEVFRSGEDVPFLTLPLTYNSSEGYYECSIEGNDTKDLDAVMYPMHWKKTEGGEDDFVARGKFVVESVYASYLERLKLVPDTLTVVQETMEITVSDADAAAALAVEQTALAEKWAEEDEDVEVEAGKYSAKHHSAKAEAITINSHEVMNDSVLFQQNTILARVRNEITTRFITENDDYLSTTVSAPDTQISEAVGMALWFDKSLQKTKRKKALDRLLYWSNKAYEQHGLPVPFWVNLDTEAVSSSVNSQHFFWAAKAYLDHHIRYNEPTYLQKAIDICDYVINNMVDGDSPNRRITRIGSTYVSIKTVSSADTLLRLSAITGNSIYSEVWYENYEWLKANAKVGEVYYFEVESNNPSNAPEAPTIHENLEFIDGLLDAYMWTGDKSVYSEAESVYFKGVIPTWYAYPDGVQFMGDIQLGYVGRKFPMNAHNYTDIVTWDRLRGAIMGGTETNIFPHTYALAFAHSEPNRINKSLFWIGGTNDPYGNLNSHTSTYGGYRAGSNLENQTCVGQESGWKSDAISLTAFGRRAGDGLSGGGAVVVGNQACRNAESLEGVSIGTMAGLDGVSNFSVLVGARAGGTSSQERSVAVGYEAARQGSGIRNIGIGMWAIRENSGSDVVAIGYEAGRNNAESGVFLIENRNLVASNPLIKGYFNTGAIILGAPTTAVADASMGNSRMTFYLDETEGTEKLHFKVRMSSEDITAEAVGTGDGSTSTFNLAEYPVKPESETIYVNGIEATRVASAPADDSEYTIDYDTGQIVFGANITNGEDVTADYTVMGKFKTGEVALT